MAAATSTTDIIHSQALENLCRLCGGNLTKKDVFYIQKYKDLINKTVLVNLESELLDDNHPKKFCMRCFSTLRNIEKKAITTAFTIVKWDEHCVKNCTTCARSIIAKKGGRRPKKEKKERPNSSESIWSRTILNKLINQTPEENLNTKLNMTHFNPQINPQLFLCTCYLCQSLIRRPVTLTPCEHSFCLQCIVEYLMGKNLADAHCPSCKNNIKSNQVHFFWV